MISFTTHCSDKLNDVALRIFGMKLLIYLKCDIFSGMNIFVPVRKVRFPHKLSAWVFLFPAFYCLFLFVPGGFVQAQTASLMDSVLDSGAVNCSQAAYFVLEAAGMVSNSSGDMAKAFSRAADRGWLPPDAEAEKPIKLGDLSYLIMESFNLRGGLLYQFFRGPRYAYRELSYRRFIPGPGDSSQPVSGGDFFQILGNVLYATENGEGTISRKSALERLAAWIRAELVKQGVVDTGVRITGEGVIVSMSNIQFLPDSTEFTETEQAKLRKVAAILSEYPGRPIVVRGHTALAGTEAGRKQLSRARAQAVADALKRLGCRKAEEMTVEGYGAEQPLADNSTPEGQALNRRVEIIISN
jgi:outer membrane protein OmpA-like peptidoglycan-associated protein